MDLENTRKTHSNTSNPTESSSISKRATRADVARLANVSTAVVSYVINNGPRNVSKSTAERVRQAATMLNYRPNSAARALRRGKSRIIGAVVPDLTNPYFAELNDSIAEAASQHGLSCMFLTSHANPEYERACINKLMMRDADAILLTTCLEDSELSMLQQKHACQYIIFDHGNPVPGCTSICSDFHFAVNTAVEHLFSHGHTKITMLYGGDPTTNDTRLIAWREAHRQRNLVEGKIVRSYYTRRGGYEAMLSILDDPSNNSTAIFACSDMEAIGALKALHEREVKVPKDMALISFDGTVECIYAWPQLTSIRQNPNLIAKCAINDITSHNDSAGTVQIIPVTFDRRDSCGCDALENTYIDNLTIREKQKISYSQK